MMGTKDRIAAMARKCYGGPWRRAKGPGPAPRRRRIYSAECQPLCGRGVAGAPRPRSPLKGGRGGSFASEQAAMGERGHAEWQAPASLFERRQYAVEVRIQMLLGGFSR